MEEEKKVEEKGKKNTGMAALCYLGLLIIIPLITEAKNEPYVKFHIKQGLVLLITGVAASVIMIIPLLGWVLGGILYIIVLVLFIIGLVNALTGKESALPLIGQFADKINI